MVDRFYSLNYAEDPKAGAGGGNPGLITNAVTTSSKDIEIRLALGANAADPKYIHLKNQRAIVIAKIQCILDELESGVLPWPPPLV